jgi:NAD-dependent dihydropyrimidine dehydrogenase PreA subunit
MIREIININEEKCSGCGLCIPACPEGALQIIDGKARLVSDLMCDGLGACIGECPEGAISIEKREAEPYNERKVIREIIKHGENTVVAHLKHLLDHNEMEYFEEAVEVLDSIAETLPFELDKVLDLVYEADLSNNACSSLGCPGAAMREFKIDMGPLEEIDGTTDENPAEVKSELRQWPVQMHLVNPHAPYLRHADVMLAADCVAFAMGNFHQRFLKGNSLAIACPKLDQGKEVYVQKLQVMIDEGMIKSLHVVVMEVPCCSGLMHIAQLAADAAERKIPIEKTVVGIKGEVVG